MLLQGIPRPRWTGVWPIWPLAVLLVLTPATPALAAPADSDARAEVAGLKRELAAVKARLATLEQRLADLLAESAGAPAAPSPDSDSSPDAAPAAVAEEAGQAVPVEVLSSAAPGAERLADNDVPEEPDIDIGGALRFNAFFRDFDESSETKRGESGLDLFRLGIDGQYQDLLISAEYRWYPYMDTLHHGWVGYAFNDDSRVKVGIHKVPFGLLPFASHNYWFGVPYYVGLSDDYDLGVKYERTDGPWQTQAAFYKSEEQGDPTSLSRYGFDVVRSGEQQDEEVNRFNLRIARTFGAGTACEHEVGVSGQRGQLYNAATNDSGDTWAAAAHLDSRCGRWNLQLQATRYEYDPDNPPGVSDAVVRMGAFATSYEVAAEADVLVANLAYNFNVPWPVVDQVTCYNDYSRLDKRGRDMLDSQVNTTGCAVGIGGLFTYLDVIRASNMPLFEEGSLGRGGSEDWHTRINLNVGYYW